MTPAVPARRRIAPAAAALLGLLALAPGPAPAAEGRDGKREAGRIELTPFAGFRLGGGFDDAGNGVPADLDEGGAYGVVVDVDTGPGTGTQVEAMWSHQRTALRTGDLLAGAPLFDIDVDYYQIGGTVLIEETDRVKPFLAGTMGVTRLHPRGGSGDTDARFSASLGLGVKLFPVERIGIRFEGRSFLTFLSGSGTVSCASPGGCSGVVGSNDILWQFEGRVGLIVAF